MGTPFHHMGAARTSEAQRLVSDQTKILREYSETDGVRCLCKLLDHMADYYLQRLKTADENNLATIQAALAQCEKLHEAVRGNDYVLPTIL